MMDWGGEGDSKEKVDFFVSINTLLYPNANLTYAFLAYLYPVDTLFVGIDYRSVLTLGVYIIAVLFSKLG